jgi:hypothetical protein
LVWVVAAFAGASLIKTKSGFLMKFVAGFIGLWGNCGIIWGNEWQ